jgi:hypothetical protein
MNIGLARKYNLGNYETLDVSILAMDLPENLSPEESKAVVGNIASTIELSAMQYFQMAKALKNMSDADAMAKLEEIQQRTHAQVTLIYENKNTGEKNVIR